MKSDRRWHMALVGGVPEARLLHRRLCRLTLEFPQVKLCLVTIPSIIQSRSVRHYQTPPMGTCYVAAAAREAGHDVYVVDGLGEGLDRYEEYRDEYVLNGLPIDEIVARVDPATEVIGISVMFSNHWPLAREIVEALHEAIPSAIIVAGGEHLTATPGYTLETSPVDYVVMGEGEETMVELLEALGSGEAPDVSKVAGIAYHDSLGELVRTPPRKRLRDLDSLPWPAWDLVPVKRYIDLNEYVEPSARRVITLIATRGCPFECKFCSNPQMWSRRFYMRNVVDVVDEMEHYESEYGVTEFQFFDLTFVINKSWVMSFCDELLERKLDYVWKLPSGTRSEVIDAELLAKISESGCRSFTLAPETGSARVAKNIKKPVDFDRFVQIGREVRRARIDMSLNFYMIFGTPDEKLRDVLESYWFIVRMAMAGFDSVGINKFTTYPGSEFHAEFEQSGLIEYTDDYFLNLRLDTRYDSTFEGLGFEPPWGPRQLYGIVRLGYLLFFGTYHLAHPIRSLRSWMLILRDEPSSRVEAFFAHSVKSIRQRLVPRAR